MSSKPRILVISQVDVKRQVQYGYAGVGSYYADYKKYYVN